MGEAFTDRERELLEERLRELARDADSDSPPACPHCESPLERRSIPPRSDVSYVRRRLWLVCGSCGRSAVVDRPRGPRAGGET